MPRRCQFLGLLERSNMADCSGSGKAWIKSKGKTKCPGCSKTIAQLGGHPLGTVPKH